MSNDTAIASLKEKIDDLNQHAWEVRVTDLPKSFELSQRRASRPRSPAAAAASGRPRQASPSTPKALAQGYGIAAEGSGLPSGPSMSYDEEDAFPLCADCVTALERAEQRR